MINLVRIEYDAEKLIKERKEIIMNIGKYLEKPTEELQEKILKIGVQEYDN